MEIKLIEYLKSSISISSYSGCSIGCKYCILSSISDHNSIKKVSDEKELVSSLINDKYFVKNFTPISINNRTDPFLNLQIKDSTLKILDFLEKEKLNNPILLITKGYLNEFDINKLKKYNSNIFIFYTYSGISELLENRVEKLQIDTIKKLSKLKNIKLIHYWRPVIEGINTSDEIINKVSSIAVKYFQASVVSGIRINTHLKEVFKKEKLRILFNPNTEHKVIYDETYNKINNKLKELNKEYECFRKTSCCICRFNQKKDYNSNFYNERVCSRECKNYYICNDNKKLSYVEIKKILNMINLSCDFKIEGENILIDSMLDQEQNIFIAHNSKMKIKTKGIIKSKSEKVLSK